MAATNTQILNASDKTKHYAMVVGTGAPADGDLLCTNTNKYPVGTRYMNTATGIEYRRVDNDGDAADFIVSGIRAAAVADVATADGTDAGTTQTLANALKAKMNDLLTKLRTAGLLAP